MTEAARWLEQARRDFDDAARHDLAFERLGSEAAALDQYYIPTRYPNGLPGGIPADAYTRTDGDRALALCGSVIDLVARSIA